MLLQNYTRTHDLNISTTANGKVINFLDVILDRDNVYHKPYTKLLDNHRYVSKDSNYQHRILDNLNKSVHVRLSTKSRHK